MGAVVLILGMLQMAGGIFVAMAAVSAIHQILGAVAFGLGAVCFGLAAIIGRLDDAMKRERAPSPPQRTS